MTKFSRKISATLAHCCHLLFSSWHHFWVMSATFTKTTQPLLDKLGISAILFIYFKLLLMSFV